MQMILDRRLMVGHRLALMLGLSTLIATAGYAGQEELMKSVGDALAEGNATRAQLAMTMGSLNALLATDPGGDLRPAYQAYVEHAGKTKADAEATRQRVAEMNSDSTKYFGEWRTDNQKIANGKLRKVATKRLEQVKKDYQKSLESLDAASAKFVPFLTDLSDIQTALSNDLTAKGLKAAKGVFKKANHDHSEVQKEIEAAIQHLTVTQAALSPTAGAK
jgi:hypothetical protein